MKILGVDPGLCATGYGFIDKSSSISSGVIRSTSKETLGERIRKIINRLRILIREEKPNLCAVETLFFKNSAARSVILSAHLRGAIFLLLTEEEIPVQEFTPAKVKLTLTGNGRASKRQMQYMISKLLGVDRISADAADALAVAYCALKNNDLNNKGQNSK